MDKEIIEKLQTSYLAVEAMIKTDIDENYNYTIDQAYKDGVALGLKIALDIAEGRCETLTLNSDGRFADAKHTKKGLAQKITKPWIDMDDSD